MCVHVLIWIPVFNSLGFIPRVLWGHVPFLYWTFWGIVKLFPTTAEPFYIPTSNVEVFQFPHILTLAILLFIIINVKCVSNGTSWGFWFTCFWWLMILSSFSCGCWLFVCLLWRNVCSNPLVIFFLLVFLSICCWVVRVIFICWILCYSVLSHSVTSNSAAPWTVACQASLSVRILQPKIQEWVACPLPGDLPNPEVEPRSPALRADSLPSEPAGKPKNTGVASLFLLQGIFPTQELNWGLLHCRQIFYQLTYQESPSYSLGFMIYYIWFENMFSILQVVQTFLITSFDAHNLRFWWILSSLSILSIYLFFISLIFLLAVLVSYVRTHCQIQSHEDFTPMFSSKNFMILVLIFRSFIHFELIFVYDVK